MLFEELMNSKPARELPERTVPELKRGDKNYKVKGSHSTSVSAKTFRNTMVFIGVVAGIAIAGLLGWVIYTAFQIYLGN